MSSHPDGAKPLVAQGHAQEGWRLSVSLLPGGVGMLPGSQAVRMEVTSEFGTHAWRWL
jgi:hypothetical protein